MDWSNFLFETNTELSYLGMCSRAAIVFALAYLLIRISGRRSFALRSPLDNIIVILLGAVLSRAVVGASPFLPVVVSSTLIVVMHRLLAWLTSVEPKLSNWFSGKKLVLYQNGQFLDKNLKKGLIGKQEIMEQVRQVMHRDDLEKIDSIYMERDGRMSILLSNK
ncbi:DUF421 domain-containing protein [Pedobacter miscanthi]|uniref:YetF C-terminal domain-containing protein n=1 Tax=Pedobacter miscanthi TaxID=2259170 RepID=A0A366LD78_9SPHI|nr:YetF domain-containing protein [Pedobacter miscanthi]RBQ11845.1 hypothetical protein DRW42_00790 [Pedobacter miscanthi]